MAQNAPNREPIKSTTLDGGFDRAIEKQEREHGPSEAQQHGVNLEKLEDTPRGGEGAGGSPDKNNILKIVGGVVAVVVVVALGTKAVKSKKSKKQEAKEETGGVLDEAGRHLRGTGRWFGEKAESAKDKAGDVAEAAKDKVGSVVPSSVSNTASDIKGRANVTGIKAEREGLKASEKSDAAVRDAADKIIHKSGKAANTVDAKSGGFFSSIRNWLGDRKDDVVDATENVAYKVEDAVKGKK